MASGWYFSSIPYPLLPNSGLCFRASQSPPALAALTAAASSSVSGTLSAIQSSRVIACLRAKDGLMAMEAARAAIKGGISVLEVMMPTPDASMVIQGLLHENTSSLIGAGSVLNVNDARKAMIAGAKFLMSPGIVMGILHEVQDSGVLYVPGVMTPTEVLCAREAGAILVKVYPATILGGSKYISALKRPFPHIPMVASQGISIDSIKHFIDAGAYAVLLSDAIFDKDAMERRDLDTILSLASLATSVAAQAGRMVQVSCD